MRQTKLPVSFSAYGNVQNAFFIVS